MAKVTEKQTGKNRLFGKKVIPKPQKPTYLQIAKRAYELFQQRGCCHGSDQQDWYRAEKQLRKA